MNQVQIGTAGWTIPRAVAGQFPAEGTSLERYAARFDCAEINSTFHRPHRPATFERWAAAVPLHFRFSAKLPKTITHQLKFSGCEALLDTFVESISGLGNRLAVLVVQLPPSLAANADRDRRFLSNLRERADAAIVCEPRHPSWFEPEAESLLAELKVARVAADPAPVPTAALPGGWPGLAYHRLHGSPVPYRSSYDDGRLETYAATIGAGDSPVWCIFDNTASGAAAADALKLLQLRPARPARE